jgi:hypothetical protein
MYFAPFYGKIPETTKQLADGARRPRVCRCRKFKPKNKDNHLLTKKVVFTIEHHLFC